MKSENQLRRQRLLLQEQILGGGWSAVADPEISEKGVVSERGNPSPEIAKLLMYFASKILVLLTLDGKFLPKSSPPLNPLIDPPPSSLKFVDYQKSHSKITWGSPPPYMKWKRIRNMLYNCSDDKRRKEPTHPPSELEF